MQMISYWKRYKRQRGFSLTELSISISIIAMIAGSALSVAVTSDLEAKKIQTERKLDRIEEALASFLVNNLRIPCPADITLATTNASFGLEKINGASGAPNPATCSGNFSASNISGGAVPVTTLNLPDEFMFDGWGRRFSYVVDTRFINNETTHTGCTSSGAACFIDTAATSAVLTVKDDSASPQNRTADAIYVIFSHGENGHGAYPRNGGSTRINAYTTGTAYTNAASYSEEEENAEFDETGAATAFDANFIMRDYIKLDVGTAANRKYFDDILRYKTKSQTVRTAGKLATGDEGDYQIMFLETFCRTAGNIFNEVTTDCDGADDEDNCNSFASNVYLRCLDDAG